MALSADWIAMNTSTTGTGTITLGSALTGYITLADDSRITDGALVNYTIEDGNDREMGVGTYTASGTTLARTVVQRTLVSGVYDDSSPTAISLSGSAVVRCSAVADDRNFRGASAFLTSDTSIADSTTTYISFTSENYDTSSFHDTSVNPDRITIPSGVSRVRFSCVASFASSPIGVRIVSVRNSANVVLYQTSVPSFGTTVFTLTTGVIEVSSGDWFRMAVYQNSTGALNLLATTSKFEIEVIE